MIIPFLFLTDQTKVRLAYNVTHGHHLQQFNIQKAVLGAYFVLGGSSICLRGRPLGRLAARLVSSQGFACLFSLPQFPFPPLLITCMWIKLPVFGRCSNNRVSPAAISFPCRNWNHPQPKRTCPLLTLVFISHIPPLGSLITVMDSFPMPVSLTKQRGIY
ncbi:hypothetical protein V6Z11_A02G188900 [Gossypium hirsutum]